MGKKAISYLLYNLSILGTFLMLLAALGSFFAGRTDPAFHGWLPMLGLLMPAILLGNFALLVYWIVRRRVWLLFPLAAIALNWGYVAAMYQFPFGRSQDRPADLKLVTYNIHAFRVGTFKSTVEQTAALIAGEGADIVCFQEFTVGRRFGLDSIRAAFDFLPYYYYPGDERGASELAVFSRYPITASGFIPFPESDNSALWVDLSVDGRPVRVFSAHLQTTGVSSLQGQLARDRSLNDVDGEKRTMMQMVENVRYNSVVRASQAGMIRQMIDTTTIPVIVCGDFNDTPSSYTYRRMKGDLTDGFRTSGSGYGATFFGMRNLLRIDFVFYGNGLSGVTYYCPESELSDHRPVAVGIDLSRLD